MNNSRRTRDKNSVRSRQSHRGAVPRGTATVRNPVQTGTARSVSRHTWPTMTNDPNQTRFRKGGETCRSFRLKFTRGHSLSAASKFGDVSSRRQQGVKGALPNLWQNSRKSPEEKGTAIRGEEGGGTARKDTEERSERTEAKEGR